MARFPVGTAILVALAAGAYAAMMASLVDYPSSDAAGSAMAAAFAALFGIALWALLAGLLLLSALRGTVVGWARLLAAALLVLSAIAASVGASLYGARHEWALAITASLPLLLALYAFWPRPAVAVVIFLLSVAPLVMATIDALPDPVRDARQAAIEKAREEALLKEERAAVKREAEAFARLGPDSALHDYLEYLPGGDSRSRDALAGARLVKSRQSDAVDLLEAGRLEALTDLFRLDLQPVPELCRAYDDALASAASQITKARSDYLSIAIDLEQQLPNIKWLVGGGCNLNRALGVLASHVRMVSDSQRMATFAKTLDAERR